MLFRKFKSKLIKIHPVPKSLLHYAELGGSIGSILTVFVYFFDPFYDQTAILRYNVPAFVIPLGYGIIAAILIFSTYWIVFSKLRQATFSKPWKTYQHALLLSCIVVATGLLGILYHQIMIIDNSFATSSYIPKTILRLLVIGIPMCVLIILYEKLKFTTENFKEKSPPEKKSSAKQMSLHTTVTLTSPIINQEIKLTPESITYLQTSGNYVEIHTDTDSSSKLLRAPFHHVIQQLHPFGFLVQCHRRYAVNLRKIQSYHKNAQRTFLELEHTQTKIPVSKRFTNDVFQKINNTTY